MADLSFDILAATARAAASIEALATRFERLSDKLDELNGRRAEADVDVDSADAEAALGRVDQGIRAINGRKATVKVDFDKSITDQISQLGALARGLKLIALPVGAVAIVPQVGAIAASLVDLTGITGVAAGGMLALGATFATVKIGTKGMGDAMKAVADGDAKKLDEALKKLSPSAQAFVKQVAAIKPEWDKLQIGVQEKLFAGLDRTLEKTATATLPILRTGLGGIATELNAGAKGFAEWLRSGQTTKDLSTVFVSTRLSVAAIAPAATNVSRALLSVGTVGSTFLPALARHATDLTARFADWIDKARESGKLAEWMQLGIDKTAQLGRIVGNVGGALVSFFKAANDSGGDFLTNLEKITGEVERLVKSPTGQAGITAFFAELKQTTDSLLPGLADLAVQALNAVKAFAQTDGMHQAAEALSGLLTAVAPLLPVLTELAGKTLVSLSKEAEALTGPFNAVVDVVIGLVDSLGPVGPAITGVVLGFKALQGTGAIVAGFGATVAGLATRIGVSEASATRFAGVMSKVGGAIPIVGAALIGLGIAYDQIRIKTDETAKAILDGSLTWEEGLRKEKESMDFLVDSTQNLRDEGALTGAAIGELTGQTNENTQAIDTNKAATDALLEVMRKEVDAAFGLEKAKKAVALAQAEWSLAVQNFGPKSEQAANAASNLAAKTDELERQTKDAAAATKTLGDEIVETQNKALAAADADINYQQSLISVKDAQKAAAEAARDHGVKSDELKEAQLRVEASALRAATAAGEVARKNAEAAGAANADEQAAQAQKDELLRLADSIGGPVGQSLRDLATGNDTAARAHSSAEIQARLHKDELGRLAGMASGSVAQAIRDSITNFDHLGGAHATAEQKAAAQKAELQRLAAMASGPVRDELNRMADQIRTLPDKTVTVTANGQMGALTGFGAIGGPELVRMAHGGARGGMISFGRGGLQPIGYAAGGVTPGYTPGRDVHTFFSPTAGVLDLSGGEAIMRPEWTRAVGPGYVQRANAAARIGGVEAVRSVNDGQNGLFRQGFAGGGLFMGGTRPFADAPLAADIGSSLRQAAAMYPLVMARIKALMDYLSGGPGAEAALSWARTQQGKPYSWGAVGPAAYDCSGFIAAIVNVMRGRPPHTRLGTTASMPWPGFLPGPGPGLNVGNKPADHMAGTLLGVNVESSGHGHGVQVGTPQAWGATHPYFSQIWHMIAPAGGGIAGGGGFVGGGGEARAVVQRAAAAYGWGGGAEWAALDRIIQKESGWNPNAANPSSSARGLFQKMTSVHGPLESTVAGQAAWGLNYIRSRYGSPTNALAFHNAHNYYGNGGLVNRPTFGLMGESGPEAVIPLSRPRQAQRVMEKAGLDGGFTVVVQASESASAERIISTAMHQARLRRLAGRYVGAR